MGAKLRAPAIRLVAVALMAATPPSGAAAEAAPSRPDDDIAFTISGGVSLGAYEAGLTWALVRFLELTRRAPPDDQMFFRPRLAAATGASAGAINALLAAAVWCQRPGADRSDSIDGNLLQDAWLRLDLDDLLPAEPARYRAGDGIFSAEPLDLTARRIRDRIFSPEAAAHFIPGCRVPIGLTLTRVEPEQRDVAGVQAMSQRFVLSWMLEVGANGGLRVRRYPLPADRDSAESTLDLAQRPAATQAPAALDPDVVVQALLASSAFPAMFGPRPLCECTATCPAANQVRVGSCADVGEPLSARQLTCAGLPAFQGREPQLCRRDYVDGGVFDNAPIGLAIDLVEALRPSALLHPAAYFLLDPDRRRLQPARDQPKDEPGHPAGVAADLRLAGNLVSTARSVELGRAIRAKGWNRTTQRVLRDAAANFSQFAEIHALLGEMVQPGHRGAEPRDSRTPSPPASVDRATLERTISTCLDKIAADPGAPETIDPCAAAALDVTLREPAQSSEERLTPDEVIQLADRLSTLVRLRSEKAETRTLREIRRDQLAFLSGVRLFTTTFLLLADEVDRVAAAGLPEVRLRRFQAAVLNPVRRSRAFVEITAQTANAVLDADLEQLGEAGGGPLAVEAGRARAALAALPYGRLFDAGALERLFRLVAEAFSGAPGRDLSQVVGRWRDIEALLEVRSRLQQLVERTAALSGEASVLVEGAAPERSLVVSSRFAPLAGAQLSGFAAFLDEPLRRYDYYAGVYEAAHAIGTAVCANQRWDDGRRPQPARRPDAPSELDLEAADTQRCIGAAMGSVLELLDLRSSPGARHVVTALADLELTAWLGSRARAALMRSEPSWRWLEDLASPLPGDPVAATLAALTERREPCRPQGDEPLCLGEQSFDELLSALAANGYRPRSANMRLALADTDLWWSRELQRVADRMLAIQVSEPRAASDPLGGPLRAGLGAAELVTRGAADRGPAPRLQLDPSTVPGRALPGQSSWSLVAAHLVPYRLELDVARGGFGVAWLEPALRLTGGLSLVSLVEPVEYQAQVERFSSALGLLPTVHLGGVSIGVGPRWSLFWTGGASQLGLQTRISALQDRIGVTVGVRVLSPAEGAPSPWFVALSVSDLNGLVYWLTPHGRSSP